MTLGGDVAVLVLEDDDGSRSQTCGESLVMPAKGCAADWLGVLVAMIDGGRAPALWSCSSGFARLTETTVWVRWGFAGEQRLKNEGSVEDE